MNANVNDKPKWDKLKWIVALVLLVAGIVLGSIYASAPVSLRLSGWIVLACVILLILSKTAQGKKFWDFSVSARMELRKVIWPNRQEVIQSTLIVIFVVVITALFLWGIDNFFLWLVTLLTSASKG